MAKKVRKFQPPRPRNQQQVPPGLVPAFLALIWPLKPLWRNSIIIVGVVCVLGLALWDATPDRFKEELLGHLVKRNDQKLEANNTSSNNPTAKDTSPLSQNQQPSSVETPTNDRDPKNLIDITRPKQSPDQISERKRPSGSDSNVKDDEELQSKDEVYFFDLLKNATQKPSLNLSGSACRDYLSASRIIPHRFRGKVKLDLIKAAKIKYEENKFPEAVQLFEKAFQDVPRP